MIAYLMLNISVWSLLLGITLPEEPSVTRNVSVFGCLCMLGSSFAALWWLLK